MAAVTGARLLVPIVAEPVELDESGALTAEKQTDMAAVTLVAPDGQRALPVFTRSTASARGTPAPAPSRSPRPAPRRPRSRSGATSW